jgi:hypothetical protein
VKKTRRNNSAFSSDSLFGTWIAWRGRFADSKKEVDLDHVRQLTFIARALR